MSYRGHVKNGVVVFDGEAQIPEGTEVTIDTVQTEQASEDGARIPTIHERLKPLIGTIKGLPPDASKNLDHYLYGLPKE